MKGHTSSRRIRWLPTRTLARTIVSTLASSTYHRRLEWFEFCCPPNLACLVASVGTYFYSATPERLYVHLYNQNQALVDVGGRQIEIEQQTAYPWDGAILLTVTVAEPTRFRACIASSKLVQGLSARG